MRRTPRGSGPQNVREALELPWPIFTAWVSWNRDRWRSMLRQPLPPIEPIVPPPTKNSRPAARPR